MTMFGSIRGKADVDVVSRPVKTGSGTGKKSFGSAAFCSLTSLFSGVEDKGLMRWDEAHKKIEKCFSLAAVAWKGEKRTFHKKDESEVTFNFVDVRALNCCNRSHKSLPLTFSPLSWSS